MTDLYDMTEYEEGWREKPYYCSERFPTVGFGFRIGPKDAPLSQYQFTLPRTAGEVWLRCLMNGYIDKVESQPQYMNIKAAWHYLRNGSNYPTPMQDPRCCVLLNMIHQMGLDGVAAFKNTLQFIAQGDFTKAATNMLASKWASQTPIRANRAAKMMKTGQWASEYKA